MSTTNCPHCGAEFECYVSKTVRLAERYHCGTCDGKRGADCYERQIAALKAKLAKAQEEEQRWFERFKKVQEENENLDQRLSTAKAKSEERKKVLVEHQFAVRVISDECNEWNQCPECDGDGYHKLDCAWARAMEE